MKNDKASKRPALPHVSLELRRFYGLLGEELLRWPEVWSRPMFGLRAYYRGEQVFALIPDKRALESVTAIAFKPADPAQGKWKYFEIEDPGDLTGVMACLNRAWTDAGDR